VKDMVADMLRVLVVVCSGLVAGVFVAVTVSVVPALSALPAPRYIQVHRLLGKGYHPLMPAVVLLTLLSDLGLALTASRVLVTTLLAAAIACLVGVQLVSHLGNERLNRRIRAVDADTVGPGWSDPRQEWRRWHLLRTAFAGAVFVINTAVAVLLL
jgi:uncharacterized membrane protein